MEKNIRNFCIIAHIDHGKSTLADRMLEMTGTVEKRKMREQLLDQMDLERERGITIKLQPVRMEYTLDGQDYILNLIDTPGHVDFSYEVSRSLAAVEGAVLLVDASQGIQAQTVANLYLALEQDLQIVPVINKIDLPNAEVKKVKKEMVSLLGCKEDEIYEISAKTGQGVQKLLQGIIEHVPGAKREVLKPLRALIFDSNFDDYKGVIAFVRAFDGRVTKENTLHFLGTRKTSTIVELGTLNPGYQKRNILEAGEVGYIATGLKNVRDCKVGDTIALSSQTKPLLGYKEIKPMVFAGIFCKEGDDYPKLREAIEKLQLNDSALTFDPENSKALGFGFRCGFLGMLHLEIVQERLKREYDLDIIVTMPSVAYKIVTLDHKETEVRSPQDFPSPDQYHHVSEPIMKLDIFSPKLYVGALMQMASEKRAVYKNIEYLDENVAVLHYDIPLVALIIDFYDRLKSVSSGFASLNYEFGAYQECDVLKLDILVAEERFEALSSIVYRDEAYTVGKKIVTTLKETLPKQQFVIKIQAAVGGKIIASERLSALHKDVTAKLYGGDYTRKRKLLEKQKKGKKKMMRLGKVNIPSDVYRAILRR